MLYLCNTCGWIGEENQQKNISDWVEVVNSEYEYDYNVCPRCWENYAVQEDTQPMWEIKSWHEVANVCRAVGKEITVSADAIISLDNEIIALEKELERYRNGNNDS